MYTSAILAKTVLLEVLDRKHIYHQYIAKGTSEDLP
jgi:hypothetical protein